MANSDTNGIDFKNAAQVAALTTTAPQRARRLAKASIVDLSQKVSVGLPSQFEPTVPTLNGSEGVIKSYILPDGKTGVVRMRGRLVAKRVRTDFWGYHIPCL